MTVLSASYEAKRKDGEIIECEIKNAEDIYKGALVLTLDANGYLYAATDVASATFQGVAVEGSLSASVTTDGDGVRSVRVYKTGSFLFPSGQTASQAWVGFKVYVTDDGTVDLVGTPTHDVHCGTCVEFISANVIRVKIDDAANEGA